MLFGNLAPGAKPSAMISREQEHYILKKAYIPEHIPALMSLISRGEPELVEDCVAFRGDGWLILVGYPLESEASPGRVEAVIDRALEYYRPASAYIIAPSIPGKYLRGGAPADNDRYYILSLDGYAPGARLSREVKKASEKLRLVKTRVMNDGHRELTREFLERVTLPDTIKELYLSMPRYVEGSDTALVLEARTVEDKLSAYFVVDTAAEGFLTYLVGCHSKKDFVSHASDYLFHEMVSFARDTGKREINLGLGVNPGIARFKTKWGGSPGPGYQSCEYIAAETNRKIKMAAPRPETAGRDENGGAKAAPSNFMLWPLRRLKGERKLRMAWKLHYRGKESVLAASAHFSPYSFRTSLERLVGEARTVIFEGPLDAPEMEKVRAHGTGGGNAPSLCDALRPSTIEKINLALGCPERMQSPAFVAKARAMGLFDNYRQDETRGLRPWMALFRIWTRLLSGQGWRGSVDLEAYCIARAMGRKVVFLETIEDQVAAMEGIPFEKIVSFFEDFDRWEGFARRYRKNYVKGDIDAIMDSTLVFPTRCASIVDRRDPVFFEGMKPYVEEGGALAFFGVIHMRGVISLLRQWGCEVKKM